MSQNSTNGVLTTFPFLKRFGQDQRGAAAIMFGIFFVMALAVLGLGVDMGRAFLVRGKLISAMDASLLGAVASMETLRNFEGEPDIAVVQREFQNLFAANYPANYMGSDVTAAAVGVTEGNRRVFSADATVTIDTMLMGVVAKMYGGNADQISARVENEVEGALDGGFIIEVALVLDTTGSMGTGNKMPDLKEAVRRMLNGIYGSRDFINGLTFSVVPYNIAVNLESIGDHRTKNWAKGNGWSGVHNSGYKKRWFDDDRGEFIAVFANRIVPGSGGADLIDSPPSNQAYRYIGYYDSYLGFNDSYGVSGTHMYRDYPATDVTWRWRSRYKRDEDGNRIPIQERDEDGNPVFDDDGDPVYTGRYVRERFKYYYEFDKDDACIDAVHRMYQTGKVTSAGTGTACALLAGNPNRYTISKSQHTGSKHASHDIRLQEWHDAATKSFSRLYRDYNFDTTESFNGVPTMLFASSSKSSIQAAVDAMVPSGMTRINVGLMWGWATLSERWRGWWDGSARPLPYIPAHVTNNRAEKILILMTDGKNDSFHAASDNATVRGLCNAMKADAVNITIYTVAFGADANVALLEACAATPDKAYEATAGDDLIAAFSDIGDDIRHRALRLSK